jgi:UDP:flavonoid glycosyltransferase YjiC (YdhE family)
MTAILITSTPVHGHVAPLLPVTRALVAAGHDVRFLTGARYRRTVEEAGARYLPLPADADFDDRSIDASFPGRIGLTGPAAIRYDMLEIFLKPVPAQVAAVREALAAEPTDVILSESMFAGMIAFVGRSSSNGGATPPVVNLGIVPLGVKSRDTAPFGLGVPPLPGPLGRVRNSLLAFVAERMIFAPVQREAQRLALELTGRPMPGFFLDWPSRADAIVQFTVPGFEYPRSDLPRTVHFVGPVSASAPAGGALPDWWHLLDGSKPVVHVSQGTVANQDYDELILPAITGLADEDVLVVVSTGGRRVSTVPGRIPPNVLLAEYLPYDELLPKTDVLVTNGGYGGVHFAMRHGVPIVVAGMTEDKAEVSARVAWSGVGVNLRTNRPQPSAIAAAVRRVLADGRYAQASARIGREIAEAPGADGILPVIDALVSEREGRSAS